MEGKGGRDCMSSCGAWGVVKGRDIYISKKKNKARIIMKNIRNKIKKMGPVAIFSMSC